MEKDAEWDEVTDRSRAGVWVRWEGDQSRTSGKASLVEAVRREGRGTGGLWMTLLMLLDQLSVTKDPEEDTYPRSEGHSRAELSRQSERAGVPTGGWVSGHEAE